MKNILVFLIIFTCSKYVFAKEGIIGIAFERIENEPTIINFFYVSSPAFISGLKIGDKILKVDNIKTKDLTLKQISKLIGGRPNTKVNLTIKRKNKQPFEINIVRRDWDLLFEANSRVVYESEKNDFNYNCIFYWQIPELYESSTINHTDLCSKAIENYNQALVLLNQYKINIKKTQTEYLEKEIAAIDLEIASMELDLSKIFYALSNTEKGFEYAKISVNRQIEIFNQYPELFSGQSWSWLRIYDQLVDSILAYTFVAIEIKTENIAELTKMINLALKITDESISKAESGEYNDASSAILKPRHPNIGDYYYYRGDKIKLLIKKSNLHFKESKADLQLYTLLSAEKFIENSKKKYPLGPHEIDHLEFIRYLIAYFYYYIYNKYDIAIALLQKSIDEYPDLGSDSRIYTLKFLANLKGRNNEYDVAVKHLKLANILNRKNTSKYSPSKQKILFDDTIAVEDMLVESLLILNKKKEALEIFDANRSKFYIDFKKNTDQSLNSIKLDNIFSNLNSDTFIIRYLTLNESGPSSFSPTGKAGKHRNEIINMVVYGITKNNFFDVSLTNNLNDFIEKLSKKTEIPFLNLEKNIAGISYKTDEFSLSKKQIKEFRDYKRMFNRKKHNAFAVSFSGGYGFSYNAKNTDKASKIAMNYCNLHLKPGAYECIVYAINGKLIELPKHVKRIKSDNLTKGELFYLIINHYRSLLSNPYKSKSEKQQQKIIANELYNFLIEPIFKQNRVMDDNGDWKVSSKKIIIVPDSILYLLPFETLIDNRGNYLIENYDVYYANSLNMIDKIENLQHNENESSLIAFGGANYSLSKNEDDFFNEDIFEPIKISSLNNVVIDKINNNKSLRGEYKKITRFEQWKNLPGSLNEVKKISNFIKNANIVTGKDVSEKTIKQMSINSELDKYKILHFATHGFINSDIPEMSALVLSQIDNSKEDNYLNSFEISDLKLKSDLVVLSACNTGVGKLFHGSGVTNIANSFFSAGTKALIMSLWYLADDSTSLFMEEFYKTFTQNNLSYVNSLNKIKRNFINGEYGEELTDTFYWAPMIYYGLDQKFN